MSKRQRLYSCSLNFKRFRVEVLNSLRRPCTIRKARSFDEQTHRGISESFRYRDLNDEEPISASQSPKASGIDSE